MNIPDSTVPLICLFCKSPLEGDTSAEYNSGDLIKCTHCGEENDYDSLIEVAKEQALETGKNILQTELDKVMKNLFKK